jgi:hypothetical protein
MTDVDDLYYAIRDRLTERRTWLDGRVFFFSQNGEMPDAQRCRELARERDALGVALKLMAIEKRRFTRMRKAQR